MKFLILCLMASAIAKANMVALYEKDNHKAVYYHNGEHGKLVTPLDKMSLYPDISTDSSKIVYATGGETTNLGIEIKELSSGKITVFSYKGFVVHPRFSKNADKVFASFKNDQGRQQIGFYNIKKPNNLKYLSTENDAFFPTPFLGEEKILFQQNLADKTKQVAILNTVSNEIEVIDEGMSPSLSFDERYVAYTKKVQNNWDVYVYDRFNKNIQRVTTDQGRDFSPSFDRLGNLYFSSDRDNNQWKFSIYTKSQWNDLQIDETVFIKHEGSLYSPKFSGSSNYKTKSLSAMPGTTRSSFGTIAHQGNIYVVGGHQGREHTYPPESFTARMSIYDIKANTWQKAAPRLHPCHGFSIAAYGEYIYAFGGFAYEASTSPSWKSLDVIERYHIPSNTWEVVGEMPRKRSSNIVAKVGNKVYLMGGWDSTPKYKNDIDGIFHDEIDVFNLENETLETLDIKLPLKRRAFSAVVSGDDIYLVGGISEGGSHFALLDLVTKFDTQTQTFEEMTPLPYGTFAPAVGILNNSLYVFGGMLKMGKWEYDYVGHIYEYKIDKNQWSHTGRYLNENKGFSQIVHFDNKIGILGGHTYKNGTDEPVASFEVFSRRK